ncbi:hypothetical protein RND81_03G204500 [Saponaria officinalis]|uniref:F-box domain-containing protein n=1 Tax=Saponaria officinalis TaxID=3572 RepID=A0AAW1MA41_SAPOF
MDDVNWDFLNLLNPDVACKILTCLDDPGDIVRASSVSRVWRDFIIENGISKRLCLRLFPQLSAIDRIVEISTTRQQNCSEAGCSRSAELQHFIEEHRVFSTLARRLSSFEVGECISDAIQATSTDNYPEEGVFNTLEPRDLIGYRTSYWSSTGKNDPEVPEMLTYKLVSEFCVITEVNIQPFQAFFQENSPIYSAKAVRFRMGYRVLVDEEEDEFAKGHLGEPFTDKHFVWTYTSKEFPMAQENRLQNFKLPEPVLCMGAFVQVELLGRVQRQEADGKLYICVAHVQVLGQSLAPVFNVVNTLETPGRFLLMFNPEAEFSALPSTCEEPREVTVTPEVVQTPVRGWEHILNMLRGVWGNDSEDEHHDSDDNMPED